MFDITGKTLKPVTEARSSAELEHWWTVLVEEGRAKKATESLQRSLTSTEIEGLARRVFEEVQTRAVDAGVTLPPEYILRLIGDLSGMGPLLELIARTDIEDIAINLGHIYVYTTTNGWEHVGPAPDGIGDALRVMIDRAGQRAPTPDYPIADAMLQVMVPFLDGRSGGKGFASTTSCRRPHPMAIRLHCVSPITARRRISRRAVLPCCVRKDCRRFPVHALMQKTSRAAMVF